MRIAYARFFRVRFRHGFYADGRSTGDFRVVPSPSTARLLEEYGLRFQPAADGFSVAGEVDHETLRATAGVPPVPIEPTPVRFQGGEFFRMRFYVMSVNPHLCNFSEVGSYRPGRSLFYFDNLRHDRGDGRLHLGDSVAAKRLGDPVEIVPSSTYTFRFDAPVRSAAFTVLDAFGNSFEAGGFSVSDDLDPTSEHRLDLDRIEMLTPGRLVVSGAPGGDRAVYYDPDMFGVRPFGIVEILSRTNELTPGGNNLVPVSYRMFQGSRLRGVDDFHIQLDPRATLWRYRVTKKYDGDGGIPLAGLVIDDGSAFNEADSSPEYVLFESNDPRPLKEKSARLELKQGGNKRVRTLPSPGPTTRLTRQDGADQSAPFVSELFIYV